MYAIRQLKLFTPVCSHLEHYVFVCVLCSELYSRKISFI